VRRLRLASRPSPVYDFRSAVRVLLLSRGRSGAPGRCRSASGGAKGKSGSAKATLLEPILGSRRVAVGVHVGEWEQRTPGCSGFSGE